MWKMLKKMRPNILIALNYIEREVIVFFVCN
jgi:hypothetical protein